jgi:hypothetical protein
MNSSKQEERRRVGCCLLATLRESISAGCSCLQLVEGPDHDLGLLAGLGERGGGRHLADRQPDRPPKLSQEMVN